MREYPIPCFIVTLLPCSEHLYTDEPAGYQWQLPAGDALRRDDGIFHAPCDMEKPSETIYSVNINMLTSSPAGHSSLLNRDMVKQMSPSLPEILVKPDAFFSSVLAEKESLKMPALIVLAGGIVAAIYGYLMGELSAKMMAGVMPGMDTIITLSATLGALIGTFIFWLIVAGIFFGLSAVLKGSGSFNRVLEVVGYGYLPQIIGSLITLVAAFIYIPRITVPALTKAALEDPALMQEATKAFMHDPAMMELTQITTLVSIVFMLWSAHIWIFGMRHARGLSPRDAAICVGVPVVLYVLYLTWNLGVM